MVMYRIRSISDCHSTCQLMMSYVIRGKIKSVLWCNVERKYFHEDLPLSLYAPRMQSGIGDIRSECDQWWVTRWGHVTRPDHLLLVWWETRGCTGCSQWPHCPMASVTPSLSQGQLQWILRAFDILIFFLLTSEVYSIYWGQMVIVINDCRKRSLLSTISRQVTVFIGSVFMTLILMLWLLSYCSLTALWVLDCSLSALWPRKMKIDCSRQTCAGQTDRRTKWLLELLSEPKNITPLSEQPND